MITGWYWGGFELSLDASNVVNTLEARLVLENHTTRPIRFHFTEYEFSIEGLLIKAIIAPTVIPAKGRLTTFPRCGLSRANYLLLGTNTQGKMKYTVEYGNPNLPVSRRATKTLIVDVFKRNGGNTVNWNWMGSGEESDTPI